MVSGWPDSLLHAGWLSGQYAQVHELLPVRMCPLATDWEQRIAVLELNPPTQICNKTGTSLCTNKVLDFQLCDIKTPVVMDQLASEGPCMYIEC